MMQSKEGDGDEKDNTDQVLTFNDLQYELEPDLSVVRLRTRKSCAFASDNWTSSAASTYTTSCQLNFGSDALIGPNCAIEFDINLQQGGQVMTWWRNDSAFNTIQELKITDRSGNELERIQDANKLAAILLRVEHNLGNALTGETLFRTGIVPASPAVARRCVLPLNVISGLFRSRQPLPPQLMSGLRIQLTFVTTPNLGKWPIDVSGNDNYTISKLKFRADTMEWSDAISRKLNTTSASDGLEIQYKTYTMTKTLCHASENVQITSSKALSRVFGAIVALRSVPEVEDTAQPVGTDVNPLTSYQFNAGNLFVPFQKTTGDVTQVSADLLYDVLQKTNTLPVGTYKMMPDLSMADYNTVAASSEVAGSMAPIILDLERSTVQDISGTALNNSRVLTFRGTIPDVVPREMRMWVQYQKNARAFLTNLELEE